MIGPVHIVQINAGVVISWKKESKAGPSNRR